MMADHTPISGSAHSSNRDGSPETSEAAYARIVQRRLRWSGQQPKPDSQIPRDSATPGDGDLSQVAEKVAEFQANEQLSAVAELRLFIQRALCDLGVANRDSQTNVSETVGEELPTETRTIETAISGVAEPLTSQQAGRTPNRQTLNETDETTTQTTPPRTDHEQNSEAKPSLRDETTHDTKETVRILNMRKRLAQLRDLQISVQMELEQLQGGRIDADKLRAVRPEIAMQALWSERDRLDEFTSRAKRVTESVSEEITSATDQQEKALKVANEEREELSSHLANMFSNAVCELELEKNEVETAKDIAIGTAMAELHSRTRSVIQELQQHIQNHRENEASTLEHTQETLRNTQEQGRNERTGQVNVLMVEIHQEQRARDLMRHRYYLNIQVLQHNLRELTSAKEEEEKQIRNGKKKILSLQGSLSELKKMHMDMLDRLEQEYVETHADYHRVISQFPVLRIKLNQLRGKGVQRYHDILNMHQTSLETLATTLRAAVENVFLTTLALPVVPSWVSQLFEGVNFSFLGEKERLEDLLADRPTAQFSVEALDQEQRDLALRIANEVSFMCQGNAVATRLQNTDVQSTLHASMAILGVHTAQQLKVLLGAVSKSLGQKNQSLALGLITFSLGEASALNEENCFSSPECTIRPDQADANLCKTKLQTMSTVLMDISQALEEFRGDVDKCVAKRELCMVRKRELAHIILVSLAEEEERGVKLSDLVI